VQRSFQALLGVLDHGLVQPGAQFLFGLKLLIVIFKDGTHIRCECIHFVKGDHLYESDTAEGKAPPLSGFPH